MPHNRHSVGPLIHLLGEQLQNLPRLIRSEGSSFVSANLNGSEPLLSLSTESLISKNELGKFGYASCRVTLREMRSNTLVLVLSRAWGKHAGAIQVQRRL